MGAHQSVVGRIRVGETDSAKGIDERLIDESGGNLGEVLIFSIYRFSCPWFDLVCLVYEGPSAYWGSAADCIDFLNLMKQERFWL